MSFSLFLFVCGLFLVFLCCFVGLSSCVILSVFMLGRFYVVPCSLCPSCLFFFVFGLVLSFFFVSFSFFVCYAFLFWGVERQVLEDVSVIMEFSLR